MKSGPFDIKDPAFLVRAVIHVNIGMYLLSLILTSRSIGMGLNPLTALSPDTRSLLLLGATGVGPILHQHHWWTLLSANYLHGSLLHLFFNMMAFYQLAPFIIREYGPWRLVLLYSVGGIIGFYVSYLAGVQLTIGASAAVCALIGAALYYGKTRGGAYGQMVYRQVGGWVLGIFLFGLLVPGINNWGHGGGLLGGVILAFLMGYGEKRPEGRLHWGLAWGAILVTILVLAFAALSGIYTRLTG